MNQTAEASLTASDTLTASYVKRAYNKLDRAGIPGPYIALAHPDVIFDLQAETGETAWTRVNNYADPSIV